MHKDGILDSIVYKLKKLQISSQGTTGFGFKAEGI